MAGKSLIDQDIFRACRRRLESTHLRPSAVPSQVTGADASAVVRALPQVESAVQKVLPH